MRYYLQQNHNHQSGGGHWTGSKISKERWTLADSMGPSFVIPNNLIKCIHSSRSVDPNSLVMINLTWFPWPVRPWLLFAPLISISELTGDAGSSLAVALRMIDLFAKWLSSIVATLARGCFWKHQLQTATDNLSLLLGIHMSTVAGSGTQVWSKMLRAVVTLKYRESPSALSRHTPVTLEWQRLQRFVHQQVNEQGISYITGVESVFARVDASRWI